MYLLQSNRQSRANTMSRSNGAKNYKNAVPASTYGPNSASALLPRLVPQLTGDSGIMKRFSISSWGTSGSFESRRSSLEDGLRNPDVKTAITQPVDVAPLNPQSTGGLWSSWWTSSGGDKPQGVTRETEKTAQWYVDIIRNARTSDTKMVKHLISLRVLLSTANLAWIEDFVNEESGLTVLNKVLGDLVVKAGKKKLADVEEMILVEVIKCLRVLLNTQVGHSFIAHFHSLTYFLQARLRRGVIRLNISPLYRILAARFID